MTYVLPTTLISIGDNTESCIFTTLVGTPFQSPSVYTEGLGFSLHCHFVLLHEYYSLGLCSEDYANNVFDKITSSLFCINTTVTSILLHSVLSFTHLTQYCILIALEI